MRASWEEERARIPIYTCPYFILCIEGEEEEENGRNHHRYRVTATGGPVRRDRSKDASLIIMSSSGRYGGFSFPFLYSAYFASPDSR